MRILSLNIGPRQRDLLLLIVAAVVAIFVYAGCGGNVGGDLGDFCSDESPCGIGVCDTTGMGASGTCIARCLPGECLTAPNDACGLDGRCSEGLQCTDHEACLDTQVCDGTSCKDAPVCTNQEDCNPDYTCQNEICTRNDVPDGSDPNAGLLTSELAAEPSCGPGEVLNQGLCLFQCEAEQQMCGSGGTCSHGFGCLCEGSNQCPDGYTCGNPPFQSACARIPDTPPSCEAGGCPEGQVCDPGSGSCMEVACDSSAECPNREVQICVNGRCTPHCSTSGCANPETQICDGGTGQCIDRCMPGSCAAEEVCEEDSGLCMPACQDDDQCPFGTSCDAGLCVPGCSNDSGCSEGEACNRNNGRCQGNLSFAVNPQAMVELSSAIAGESPEVAVSFDAPEGELQTRTVRLTLPGNGSDPEGFGFEGFPATTTIGTVVVSLSDGVEITLEIVPVTATTAYVNLNGNDQFDPGVDAAVLYLPGSHIFKADIPDGGDGLARDIIVAQGAQMRVTMNAGILRNPLVPGIYSVTVGLMSVDPNTGSADDLAGTPPFTASFEQMLTITTAPSGDSDGDGVNDDVDDCADSDLNGTVTIGECDSGVTNHLGPDGCSIADHINNCDTDAPNHGQYVKCVTHLTNDLKKKGVISGKEKGSIVSCAARSKK